jgi:hypothetical protein
VQGYLQIFYWTSNIRRRLSIIGLSESYRPNKARRKKSMIRTSNNPASSTSKIETAIYFGIEVVIISKMEHCSLIHYSDLTVVVDTGGPRLCKSDENSCVKLVLGFKSSGHKCAPHQLPLASQSCWRPPASDHGLHSAEQLSRSPHDKDDRGKCLKKGDTYEHCYSSISTGSTCQKLRRAEPQPTAFAPPRRWHPSFSAS